MRSSKELVTGLTLFGVVAAGLSTAACGTGTETGEQHSTAATHVATATVPKCLALDSVNLISANKSGGENAKNTGDCAAVYDQATSRTIGEIASGEAFVIDCASTKPTAFKVETPEGITGFTNLDGLALLQSEHGAFAANLAAC